MDIVHESTELLVVRKRAGRLAQPDHTGDKDVLTRGKEYLTEHTEENDPFLGLVHRLDRPTSGLMVLARSPAVARALSAQFRDRTVSKEYLAVVQGALRGVGTWTNFIAKPDRRPILVSPDHPDGKRAHLQWQALVSEGAHTLLRIQLHTGRPHQIRLQASDRDNPIVGDTRYGATSHFGRRSIALHHAVLRLEDPSRPCRRTFVASPPDPWASHFSDAMMQAVDRALRQAQPPEVENPTDSDLTESA